MIASSNIFRPHVGRVIRDLFRQLHAARNVTTVMEPLVYNDRPRGATASSYLVIIFGRIASGVPLFLRSTAVSMQPPDALARCTNLGIARAAPPCTNGSANDRRRTRKIVMLRQGIGTLTKI